MTMLETDVKSKFDFLGLPDMELDQIMQEAMHFIVNRAIERNPGCLDPAQRVDVMFIGSTVAESLIQAPLEIQAVSPQHALVIAHSNAA